MQRTGTLPHVDGVRTHSTELANDNEKPGASTPLVGVTTTEQFLETIFGPEWRETWVCAFGPGTENWAGRRYTPGYIRDDTNNYFCIGVLDPKADRRSSDAVRSHHLVFADDIGTKVDPEKWEALFAMGFPKPTFRIETSPGNQTWIWVLRRPISKDDADGVRAVRAVREAFARLGLSDPLKDDARYIRLPSGINSKQKYFEQYGFAPSVSLVEWNPGATLDIEQAATILLGSDWRDKPDEVLGIKGGTSFSGALQRTADLNNPEPIIQLAVELGMNCTQVRAGVVEADCPNIAAHTTRADTGFAFLGNGLMECSHASCQHLRTPDFERMICEAYDERQEVRLALGMLGLDEPKTADAFLARAAFQYGDAKAGRSIAQVIDEANATAEAAEMARRQIEDKLQGYLSELDQKYALVENLNGVLVRKPKSGGLHDTLSYQQFTTYNNGRFAVSTGKFSSQGLGSYWLGRPETPRFERVGLWPVGMEPKGTLNLFEGFPKTSSRKTRRALAAGQSRSCRLILEFIHDVICSGDRRLYDYVLNWLAWVVHNPLEKPGVNLVLIGQQGTGKGTFGRMLLDIFGPRYSLHVTQQDHLLGRFSGHLEGVLFVLIDEAMFGKDPRTVGVYKARTTEETILIERKGQTPHTAANHMTIVILSNSIAAAPVEANDRRATVIEVSSSRRQDTAYFAQIWNEWDTQGGREEFIDFLMARDITAFDPSKPFATNAKAAMASATADPVTSWFLDVLSSGQMSGALPDPSGNPMDWSAGPVTVPNRVLQSEFEVWCRNNRVAHRVSPEEFHHRIDELCPARTKHRVRVQGKPTWVHIYPALPDAVAAAHAALGGVALPADDQDDPDATAA